MNQRINSSIINRLGGYTYSSISTLYNVDASTVSRWVNKHKDRMQMFKLDADGKYILSDASTVLNVKNRFLCSSIEITGDPADGVIFCNDLLLTAGRTIKPSHYGENLGIDAPFKCGLVFVENNRLGLNEVTVDSRKNIINSEDLYNRCTMEDLCDIQITWQATNNFINIAVGRDIYQTDSSHPKFKEALNLLVNERVQDCIDLINAAKGIEKYVNGDVEIYNGALYYKGLEIKNGLSNRIIEAMREGTDFEFFIPFLKNLMKNPSESAKNRLFDFLTANDIEITKTGHIIAWKKVNYNYKDIFTGTMDNSIGSIVEIDRKLVDSNDYVTCSSGLHACSKSYLRHFASSYNSRVVKVRIHPKDVVAIPVDYNNAKLRCCKYKVISEVKHANF